MSSDLRRPLGVASSAFSADANDDIPVVRVSPLKALEGDAEWTPKILELMEAVGTDIPEPVRDADKPFLMPIEDVFTITGRGTVVTGRVEQGKIKVGNAVESSASTRTRRRSSPVSSVPEVARLGRRATTSAAPPRYRARGGRARPGAREARLDHAAHAIRGRGLRPLEGRGRPPHAVLQRLPPAVLLPHDGRDRHGQAARRARRWSCRATTRTWRSSSSSRSPWTRASASPSAKAAAPSAPRRHRDHQVAIGRRKRAEEEMAQGTVRIRLKGYDHQQLDRSAPVDRRDRAALGRDDHWAGPLPTEKNVYCVIRSPFKDKDSREHFEVRTHKRLIDIHQPEPEDDRPSSCGLSPGGHRHRDQALDPKATEMARREFWDASWE